MADVDEYPLSYLPPMRFDPFNNRSLMRKGGAGGSPSLTWRTGYPYDLMEDLPPLGAKNTTEARGGAVKYIEPSYPGNFPQIDRYFAFVAKEEEISLWGYVKQAAEWNWKVFIPFDGKKVEQTLFDSASTTYLGAVIKDQNKESSVWGYNESGKRNYRIIADNDEAKLEAWDNGASSGEPKYIIATTKDFPESVAGNTRNKRLVLASESYKDTKPQLVKLRELELDLPKGCPFDLTFAINENTNSAVGAVKHTSCTTVDGEKVGSGVFERYAAANADTVKTGFTTYFGTAQDGYLDASTKGQGETFVYGYADQSTSAFRIRALGADQSMELWSTARDCIIKAETVTSSSVVYGRFDGNFQFRNLADAQKAGTTAFNSDNSGFLDCSTKGQGETFVYGYADQSQSSFRLRALGADQSLELWSTANDTILKGENVTTQTVFYGRFSGDYQFSLKANATQANLAVFDATNRSYGDVKVNVTESVYYGYADNSTASHRVRSIAFKSEVELWKSDGSAYGLMRVEPFRSSVWVNSGNETYNVKIAADQGADSSYCRVYGQNNNVFASLHTLQGKASAWGYTDNQQNLFTNEASSTAVFWRGQMSGVYNTSDVKPSEVGNWGYVSNGANQYTLGAQSGEVFLRGQLSASFVGISVKPTTADIWGYTSGVCQWKCDASSSQSRCQTFNSSGWAQISATASKVAFDASLNNDYSYLTHNTLRIQYANGDSATVNPGVAFLNYNSGSYLQLYGGGIYMTDGSNWVDIQPPGGKDAYFQQVSVCVDGETKTAYVLMTEPE